MLDILFFLAGGSQEFGKGAYHQSAAQTLPHTKTNQGGGMTVLVLLNKRLPLVVSINHSALHCDNEWGTTGRNWQSELNEGSTCVKKLFLKRKS